MTDAAPTDRRLDVAATGALVVVTLTVVVGLGRLLVDLSFLGPVLAATLTTHATAWAVRRRGWGPTRGLVLPILVGVATIVGLRYGNDIGGLTAAISDDLRDAWQVFQDEGAPAPVVDGFVVAAMAGAVLIASTSDALAFRVGAPAEAIAPAGGLFLFTTVLGGPDHRALAAVMFLAAVLGFALVHRVARLTTGGDWLAAPRGRGADGLLRAGALLAGAALVGGAVLGPVLPGADAAPIVDLDPEGGSGRVTVSPLVEIQSRLVDQPDLEAFTVRSSQRSYWRLTALDEFDGSIWSAGGDYVGADGELPQTELSATPGVERRQVEQEFQIGALSAIWLPAAYQPAAVDSDVDVEWNPASSTLVVDPDRDSADDLAYRVVSDLPVITAELVAGASPSGRALDPLRRLPTGFSATASETASRITAGEQTAYGQALALQDWFRSNFTYSLDVSAGHSVADIDEFLAARVGYCEQFSGTFAAMARSIGLPARVAVGFTPGDEDPDDPGLFRVRGEHAHAWPEVHLGEVGWVAFEPTPGRGAPSGEAYTGVAEQQAGELAPGVPTPTTVAPTTTQPEGAPATAVPSATLPTSDAAAPSSAADNSTDWRRPALLGVVLLTLLWALGLPALTGVRRRRARHLAADRPAAQIDLAWREASDSLDRAGMHRRPTETPLNFSDRVRTTIGDPEIGLAVRQLATGVTTAWYGGPGAVDAEQAHTSLDVADGLGSAVRRRIGARRWWLRGLDPRGLRY